MCDLAQFRDNHALQCGFCTPAFLLSAYELLRDNPTMEGVDLAAELSGVLCRCTGYRGILAAIRAVAAAYPDGIPEARLRPVADSRKPAP
jgi:carbon-monoxide dehydrogenase small subunit